MAQWYRANTSIKAAIEKADACDAGAAALSRMQRENDALRGLLAALTVKLHAPCHYCGLDDILKCRSGFPGCALADDWMIGTQQIGTQQPSPTDDDPAVAAILRDADAMSELAGGNHVQRTGVWVEATKKLAVLARARLRERG